MNIAYFERADVEIFRIASNPNKFVELHGRIELVVKANIALTLNERSITRTPLS